MKTTKETILVIVFNRFYPGRGAKYLEVTSDATCSSCVVRELKRAPLAARFDMVMETGEGSYNQWNAHKAERVYGHALERAI